MTVYISVCMCMHVHEVVYIVNSGGGQGNSGGIYT